MHIKTEQISIWIKEIKTYGAGLFETDELPPIKSILAETYAFSKINKHSSEDLNTLNRKLNFNSKCQKAFFSMAQSFFSLDKNQTNRLIKLSSECQKVMPSLSVATEFFTFTSILAVAIKKSSMTFGFSDDEFSVDEIHHSHPEALGKKLLKDMPAPLILKSFFCLFVTRLSIDGTSKASLKHIIEDHLMEMESEGLGYFLMDFRKNYISGKTDH
jgi:hypothetical protein